MPLERCTRSTRLSQPSIRKEALEIKFDLFEKGSGRSTHLNIGTMKAGDWASTVPGSAELDCRISFIPGENSREIKALVEKTVLDSVKNDPWMQEHPPVIEWYGWHAEPWLQDTHAPFVQTFKKTAEDGVGREPEFSAVQQAWIPICLLFQYAGSVHGANRRAHPRNRRIRGTRKRREPDKDSGLIYSELVWRGRLIHFNGIQLTLLSRRLSLRKETS